MGRKLLLADDSVTIQKVVALTFASEDMEIITASDGQEALDKLADILPDVALVDVFMPKRDGYEVCAHIKQTERLSKIPVILLVGAFEPFDPEKARRAGADDYLTKPFQSIKQLVNKVNNLLQPPPQPEEPLAPALPAVEPATYGPTVTANYSTPAQTANLSSPEPWATVVAGPVTENAPSLPATSHEPDNYSADPHEVMPLPFSATGAETVSAWPSAEAARMNLDDPSIEVTPMADNVEEAWTETAVSDAVLPEPQMAWEEAAREPIAVDFVETAIGTTESGGVTETAAVEAESELVETVAVEAGPVGLVETEAPPSEAVTAAETEVAGTENAPESVVATGEFMPDWVIPAPASFAIAAPLPETESRAVVAETPVLELDLAPSDDVFEPTAPVAPPVSWDLPAETDDLPDLELPAPVFAQAPADDDLLELSDMPLALEKADQPALPEDLRADPVPAEAKAIDQPATPSWEEHAALLDAHLELPPMNLAPVDDDMSENILDFPPAQTVLESEPMLEMDSLLELTALPEPPPEDLLLLEPLPAVAEIPAPETEEVLSLATETTAPAETLPLVAAAPLVTEIPVAEADLPEAGAVTETAPAPADAVTTNQEPDTFVTPPPSVATLSPEMVDAIARRVVELMSDHTVREIAWEIVPDMAELHIKKRLDAGR